MDRLLNAIRLGHVYFLSDHLPLSKNGDRADDKKSPDEPPAERLQQHPGSLQRRPPCLPVGTRQPGSKDLVL